MPSIERDGFVVVRVPGAHQGAGAANLSHKSSTTFSHGSQEPLLRNRASLRSLRSASKQQSNNNEEPLPLPPTINNLDAADRTALIRSARKLGKVLGTTPQVIEGGQLPPQPSRQSSDGRTSRDQGERTVVGLHASSSVRVAPSGGGGAPKLKRRSTLTAAESFYRSFSTSPPKPTTPTPSLSRRTSSRLLGGGNGGTGAGPLSPSALTNSDSDPTKTGRPNSARAPLLRLAVASPLPPLPRHRRRSSDTYSNRTISSTSSSHNHTNPQPASTTTTTLPVPAEPTSAPPSPTTSFSSHSLNAYHPSRTSDVSDRENAVAQQAAATRAHRMKMAKLQRFLGENVPAELVLSGVARPRVSDVNGKPVTQEAAVSFKTSSFNPRRRLSVDLTPLFSATSPISDAPTKPLKHKRSRSIWRTGSSKNTPVDVGVESAPESVTRSKTISTPRGKNAEQQVPAGVKDGDAMHSEVMTEKERNLNVKRAYKMAQVFGVPPPHELYTSTSTTGNGPRPQRADAVEGETVVYGSGRISRQSLASLAYMLDHDRDSLYDLLSSTADLDDETETEAPLDWPYERPRDARKRTASSATAATTKSTSAPPAADKSASSSNSSSRRPSTTAPRAQAAPRTSSSISRKPSATSLKRTPSNPFVPPASWESRSPLDSVPASPLPTSPMSPTGFSFINSSTSNLIPGKPIKEPGKLRKQAPSKDRDSGKDKDKDKDKDFSARRRRAAKLSKFFGVGYHDLFQSMLAFPASGAAAAVDSATPSPTTPVAPFLQPRSVSHPLGVPIPRERDPAAAAAAALLSRPDSGMPFTDFQPRTQDRSVSEPPASTAAGKKTKKTEVTVVVGNGNLSARGIAPNFNDTGEVQIKNVLNRLREL